MENAKKHWEILRELKTNLANKVRSFMVISVEGEGAIVATEDGQGYWLGEMDFGWGNSRTATKPTLLKVSGLVQMAQCESHIVLLNKQGQIYTFGRNNYGQLGLGTVDKKTHFKPKLISSLLKFTSVSCGYEHSLALTEDGKVCGWGRNDWGQVGLFSSTDSIPSLSQIPEFDTHQVVAVECGAHHSLALTDQGEVYSWGKNDKGQLGNRSEISTHIPTRIPTPSPVQSMAAGYQHTLLLTQTGEVYACGSNRHGQLGLSTYTTESSVSLVRIAGLPPISQITSHLRSSLSIAMSSDQQCFIWGPMANGMSTSIPKKLMPFYTTIEAPFSSFSLHRNTPHSVSIPAKPDSTT